MTSRGHWRDRLLGTLQGQLQLATYVTVFLGFTGASCAGLWISERTLFRQHSMAIEQSAAGIAQALERLPDPPSRLRVQQQLESCLLYTSPSPRDRTRSRMPSSA